MTYLIDQSTVELGSVTTHKRANSIAFYNPPGQAPYINVQENTYVTGVPEGFEATGAVRQTRNLSLTVTEAFDIPLINPLTGESIGSSVNSNDVYVTLFSLYIYMRGVVETPET